MAGVSVFLAMPTHRDIPAQTAIALLETQRALWEKNILFHVAMECGGSLVHHSRAALVHQFMKTDFTHLFWVDSDIVWDQKDFLKLLALGTKMEIVCGAYPTKTEPPVFFMRYGPESEIANEYGCSSIHGIGIGFTVVQRKVIKDLYDRAPKVKFSWSDELIPYVFRQDKEGNEPRGEDMAFFADARELGYQIHLDPMISLGHIGPKVYRANIAEMR